MYKDCGYREKPAQDMEAEFDECLSRNNGESWVHLSVAFESCLGYDYSHLNNTIAEPIENLKEIVNKKLIELSLKTCRMEYSSESTISSEAELQALKRKKTEC